MMKLVHGLCLAAALALTLALYLARSEASSGEDRLERLQAELERERGRISQLQAELALKDSPENLRRLALAHLDVQPMQQEQRISLSMLQASSPEAVPEPVVSQASYVRRTGGRGQPD